jgi:hypothetical protein
MAERLKPFDIDRLVKPGKYADGDGLYLAVGGPTPRQSSECVAENSCDVNGSASVTAAKAPKKHAIGNGASMG